MKRSKRLIKAIIAAFAMTMFAQPVQAQSRVDEFGIFDHMSLGLTLASSSASVCNVVSSVSYDWLFAFSCSDMVSMPSMDRDDDCCGGDVAFKPHCYNE